MGILDNWQAAEKIKQDQVELVTGIKNNKKFLHEKPENSLRYCPSCGKDMMFTVDKYNRPYWKCMGFPNRCDYSEMIKK